MVLNSIVNNVTFCPDRVAPCVVKRYKGVALGTGIKIPISRVDIEYRVLSILATLATPISCEVAIPVVYDFDAITPALTIQYIDGTTLEQYFLAMDLPDLNLFGLGYWLRVVEVELFLRKELLFYELWEAQCEVSMMLNKLKGKPIISSNEHWEPVVSLGDVGLSNLILMSSNIWPIDFEFAHISLAARDVGQLWAQLITHSEMAVVGSVGLLNGYVAAGGDLSHAKHWKNAFLHYYESKKLASKG